MSRDPTSPAPDASTPDELLGLAHRIGVAERMAILGEGNVSAALGGDRLLIKASGTSLATLTPAQLVEVRPHGLLRALADDHANDAEVERLLLDSRVDPAALKPSVETLFHAWLLQLPGVRCVGHTHPIAVNQLLCSPRAEDYARGRLFPDQIVYCGGESVLIPYVDPGLVLARRIAAEVTSFSERVGVPPKVILLENHGLIALGGSVKQVEATLLMAEKAAQVFVGALAAGGPRFMPEQERDRIAGRTDEHYRQRMLEGAPADGG